MKRLANLNGVWVDPAAVEAVTPAGDCVQLWLSNGSTVRVPLCITGDNPLPTIRTVVRALADAAAPEPESTP